MVESPTEKLGTLPFVIGGMSFIPGLGIFFGLVSIVWGTITKREGGKKLRMVGALGIAFSMLLYSALFYFGFAKRGGMYDELRTKLADSTLTSLVPAIEFYKAQKGKYPESLEELQKSQPEGSMTFVFDPTDVNVAGQPRYFHYQLVDESHYYLLGVGPDGKPFTADDQHPNIHSTPEGNIGYIRKEPR